MQRSEFFGDMGSPATVEETRRVGHVPSFKRTLDLLLLFVSLPIVLGIGLVVAIAIRFTSQGPVLFQQTRVGYRGQPFTMYKFRTMYVDAEQRLDELRAKSDRKGVCFKIRNDPRVTSIGAFLRRSSLDELPQLINVFLGNMSLVGPRPALPCEVAQYSQIAQERLKGLPGLTGLWQVKGRADIPFEEMIALDLEYLETCSLRTDLYILACTFGAVLSGRGAY